MSIAQMKVVYFQIKRNVVFGYKDKLLAADYTMCKMFSKVQAVFALLSTTHPRGRSILQLSAFRTKVFLAYSLAHSWHIQSKQNTFHVGERARATKTAEFTVNFIQYFVGFNQTKICLTNIGRLHLHGSTAFGISHSLAEINTMNTDKTWSYPIAIRSLPTKTLKHKWNLWISIDLETEQVKNSKHILILLLNILCDMSSNLQY